MLYAKIVENNMTKGQTADKVGISRQSFLRKINGETEFTSSELIDLVDVLKLTVADFDFIFFDNRLSSLNEKNRKQGNNTTL